MAYDKMMYEGDGFIRKGPEPKKIAVKDDVAADKDQARPATKPARRRGGITMFRFTRLLFSR
jgi:hypothetical protein